MRIHNLKSFGEFYSLIKTNPKQIDEVTIDPTFTSMFTIHHNFKIFCVCLSQCQMLQSLILKSCPLGKHLTKNMFFMLSDAIGACASLEILDLSNTALQNVNSICLKHLGKNLLKLSKLYKLNLSDNAFPFSNMTRTAKLNIEAFFEMLSHCRTLQELYLENMLLNTMHVYYAQKLASALEELSTLKILNLNLNNFGRKCLPLQFILLSCKTLKVLFLKNNNLPKIYSQDSHEFSENDFSFSKFSAFCTALSQCKTLQTIHLDGNNFQVLNKFAIEIFYQALCSSPLLEMGGIENFPYQLKEKMQDMLDCNLAGNRIQLALSQSLSLDLQNIILAYLLNPSLCTNSISIRHDMARHNLLNEEGTIAVSTTAPLLLSQNTHANVDSAVQQTHSTEEYYAEWRPHSFCNVL